MATVETPAIIVETIAIKAPMAAVFAALTEPDQLIKWWGSKDGYRTTHMDADVRPGGAWKTVGISRDGSSFNVSGTYTLVDAPKLIEFTWMHDWSGSGDREDTLVRYELSERDGVTTLTVTHSGFTDVADREDHAAGWKVVLAWMSAYVTQ
jgi:uncharacterized protein YndB with AHSA1/START domain